MCQGTFQAGGAAGAEALRREKAGLGDGRSRVSISRPSAEQGRRKGVGVCSGETATGRGGSQKDSGLSEIGDGEVHQWIFLF